MQTFKSKFGPSLKGVFVSYESGALAASAVREGDFQPDIVTYGGTDESLKGVESGQLTASVYQNVVLMGRIAGWAAGQAVDGEKIPEKLYITPPVLDKQGVEGYPTTDEQLDEGVRVQACAGGRPVDDAALPARELRGDAAP